jgi:hypothetical protein
MVHYFNSPLMLYVQVAPAIRFNSFPKFFDPCKCDSKGRWGKQYVKYYIAQDNKNNI